MPCAYTIDCTNAAVYMAVEDQVFPYEFIDTLREIKLDENRQIDDAVYLDLRRCKTSFTQADEKLIIYYMGSLNRTLKGPVALISNNLDATFYTQWIHKLLLYNLQIASFTCFSEAEEWVLVASSDRRNMA